MFCVLNASRRHRLGHVRVRQNRSQATCSTPLGVTDLVTGRFCGNVRPFPGGAQRLSASQTWSRARLGTKTRGLGQLLCSTPLGVTDFGHATAAADGRRGPVCSTPLGVTDLVTDALGHRERDPACSTPLGVTDLVTRLANVAPRAAVMVLNASRRHRLGHSTLPRIVQRGRMTVVLNASRRHRLGHHHLGTPSTEPSPSAQRLSASQTWSQSCDRRRLAGSARCSTPLGVTDLVTSRRIEATTMCSTPLGVTDLVTMGRGVAIVGCNCAQRLSASQTWSRVQPRPPASVAPASAQRLSASQTWSPVGTGRTAGGPRGECSTPLGVTDLVTPWAERPRIAPVEGAQRLSASQTWSPRSTARIRLRRCAQRLSASQTWSPRPIGLDPEDDRECSTPLGVTDLVTPRRRVGRVLGRAQRLSASQTWSRSPRCPIPGAARVLNASRRHRLGHGGEAEGLRAEGVCSTPLGVTDLVTRPNRSGRWQLP